MVLAAEGRKANDSHADCYQYFCVPEYGTANGRLHFHAVHFMRTLPTGSVDPNFGRRVRNRRQLNSLQNTWPYGYSMPIVFFFQAEDGIRDVALTGVQTCALPISDHNLADNLQREAAEGKYRYFWFEYTPSTAEAHGMECTWYHRYHPTDNPEHPNAPLGAEGDRKSVV